MSATSHPTHPAGARACLVALAAVLLGVVSAPTALAAVANRDGGTDDVPASDPPVFHVNPIMDYVWGTGWAPGASLFIRADGVIVADDAFTGPDGSFWLDVSEVTDLAPGGTVVVRAGGDTKTLDVAALTVTDVDLDADLVAGSTTGEGDLTVGIWAVGVAGEEIHPAAGETWTADFRDVWNIGHTTSGYLALTDLDGDSTRLDWEVAPT